MSNEKSDFEHKMKNLLEHLHDSYKGYHESADDVESPSLKAWFISSAENRKGMISKLETLLSQNNIDFNHHGSIEGMAHRVFVNLKSIITGKDEKAIIAEVERGESFLLKEYQDIIHQLPISYSTYTNCTGLLQEQHNQIQQNLVKIKNLNI